MALALAPQASSRVQGLSQEVRGMEPQTVMPFYNLEQHYVQREWSECVDTLSGQPNTDVEHALLPSAIHV